MRCSCARSRARAGAPRPARATRPTRRAALRVALGDPGRLATSFVLCGCCLRVANPVLFPPVSGAAGAAADPSPSLKAPASAAGNAHPSGAPEPVPGWAACDSAAADAPNHLCTGAEAALAATPRAAGAPAAQVLAARLALIGGCRNAADAARVADLRTLAEQLGLAGAVDFAVNAPFSEARRPRALHRRRPSARRAARAGRAPRAAHARPGRGARHARAWARSPAAQATRTGR